MNDDFRIMNETIKKKWGGCYCNAVPIVILCNSSIMKTLLILVVLLVPILPTIETHTCLRHIYTHIDIHTVHTLYSP